MRPIAAVIAVLVVAISGLAVAASSHGFPSGAPGGLELDVDLNRILLWAFAFFVVIGILGAEISREKAAKSLAERRPLWQIVLGLAVWVVVVALLSPFIREVEPPVVEDVAQEAVAPRLVPAEPDGEPAAAQVSPTRMLAVAAAAVVALLVLLHTPARRGAYLKSAEHKQEPPTKHPEPAAGADQPLALSDSPRHRVLAAYARFESLASAAGLERADWETALSHARRVAAARGLDDRAVKELTHLYYRARFSQADIEEIAADRAQKLDASLQAGLRPG